MTQAYPHLFSPFTLRGVELKNRVAMAPMSTELGGLDGEVTPRMIAFYRERALGGTGLIIVEYTCVDPDTGRANPWQLHLESRQNLDGHKRLVRAVHDAGARIFVQLQHAGQYADAKSLPSGVPVGPMDKFSKKDPAKQTCRALTSAEVAGLAENFGRTAALAVEAGYDGVELHGAHGYLLTQFISPYANQRDDEWGGDFERRLAFPLAVVRAVRAAIGDRPLVYRVSADEFIGGGITIDDMEKIAPRLVEAGVDAIHASSGWGVGEAFEKVMEPMSAPEGWRIPLAARLRKATGVPVITVGQIRWPEMADAAIADGSADIVALGRPMLADPFWAAKAEAGLRDQIRPCTSCNYCISGALGRPFVSCAENPRTGTELDPSLTAETGAGKRAVVIGAGPGGMAAALMLDQSGFETHLFEARPFTGGGIIASATPPGKDKLFWYNDYLAGRLKDSKVSLHLGSAAGLDDVTALDPAVAILAAGTRRIDLPIIGADHAIVRDAFDLLMGERPLELAAGSHVLVYGGGETGCETAEFCAEHGMKVTLVSRSPANKLARSADAVYRGGLIRRLHANPLVTIVDNTHVLSVGDRGVVIETNGSDGAETRTVVVDRLYLAQGRQPDNRLADALERAGIAVSVIGDSRKVGRIGDAVHTAYQAVLGLKAQYVPPVPAAC
jgi:2,4-dienoyl-CoA reductase-like NADH-dependent reductase (Old Yellow Enzyme family)/thioredoxin reductase